jgi:DNA-binding beta-propeller fold protein YncE
MSARFRLGLPGLLAILLAALIGQAPVAAASPGRVLQPARPGLGGTHTPAQTSRWPQHRSGSFGSALVGSAPVGNGPSELALNPATHTIYVTNGNNQNGPNAGGDTVSVIDARHCNAQDISHCKGPWPTITVGNGTVSDLPTGIAIDVTTDTVYVANGGASTVSVVNGATCNATITSGCGQTPTEVPVGAAPFTAIADPANHTVYIANSGGTTVSMLNSATCNATDPAGCPAAPPPTADVGATPVNVAAAPATHTVYVTTIGAQNGWAAFNADTCNATVQTGCGTIGRLTGDPAGPNDAQVDPANDTLYTANYDNTVSAFDLRHCWAGDLAGCATDKPGVVTPFPPTGFEHDLWVAVDARLHSVYVSYQKDDTLIVIDTRACNGTHPAACGTLRPPTIHTGADPEGIVLDSQTQTLYTADEVGNTVSVIDATRCNAANTTGCRHPAPAVALPEPGASAADPAVHTAYVTTGANAVAMINTQACSTHHLAGCARAPAQATVGTNPAAVAADSGTHTVYVANFGSGTTGTVSVLDASTCNAIHTTGCAHRSTLQVPGGHPDALAVNAKTGTLYVATITAHGPNLISVFNAATCNAVTTTGCGQAPAALQAGHSAGGNSALSLAVNPATNSIYATNVITNTVPYRGRHVYVFDGATCDATDTTGCGQAPATVNAGFNPWGIAVDQATDTIYTANVADGEHPGTVSVINGATCNGTNHTGCAHTPATMAAGNYPSSITADPSAGTGYVTNGDDTVSVIPLSYCPGQRAAS